MLLGNGNWNVTCIMCLFVAHIMLGVMIRTRYDSSRGWARCMLDVLLSVLVHVFRWEWVDVEPRTYHVFVMVSGFQSTVCAWNFVHETYVFYNECMFGCFRRSWTRWPTPTRDFREHHAIDPNDGTYRSNDYTTHTPNKACMTCCSTDACSHSPYSDDVGTCHLTVIPL